MTTKLNKWCCPAIVSCQSEVFPQAVSLNLSPRYVRGRQYLRSSCFLGATPVVSPKLGERFRRRGALPQTTRLSAAMQGGVACSAKGDQIFFAIVAGVTPELFVMNLQVGHASAELASPAVAAQHLLMELLV
jgi:hypothetical protein